MRSAARLRSLSALIAAITFGAGTVDAQTTYTWNKAAVPATFLWGDADNWNASGIPGALDTVVFSSNTAGVFGTIDLGAVARPISVINFTSTSVYSLSNGTLTDVTQINQTGNVTAGTALPPTVTITTAGGGTGILTSNVTTGGQLQLQGMITAGGVTKTGANTLRLGTSGTAYNGAIAGDIVINGGTFQASAGNVSATNNPIASSGAVGAVGTINAGDDIIIGASGVTLSLTHSNVGSGSGGTYDWGRNIVANNNSFTFNADRAAGSANAGQALVGTITLGNATMTNTGGNGFTHRTDGIILNSGAVGTVSTPTTLSVDSLVGDATSKLVKTGTATLLVKSDVANNNATNFLGDIDLNQGTLALEAGVGGQPLGNALTAINIVGANTPTLSLRADAATAFTNLAINAGNSSFNFDVRNLSLGTNGFTMTASSVSLGNGTMTITGDRANARITELNLDAGSSLSTVNINSNSNTAQNLRVDSLTGNAGTTLRKTGGQTLFISAHAGTFAGKLELSGGTVQIEGNSGAALNPLASVTTPITFLTGTTLNLRAEEIFDFGAGIAFASDVITSTINVDRTGATATAKRLSVGAIDLTQTAALPKTLTVSAGNTYTFGSSEIIVNSGTGTINQGTDANVAKLTIGAGATLNKTGGSTITLTGDSSTSAVGSITLRSGGITGNVAGSLGSGGVTVGNATPTTSGFFNDQARLRYGIAGASAATGTDVTAVIGGVIDLDATPAATDVFNVQADARIQGNTAQLGALTIGGNLTVAPDAIILHDTQGTSSPVLNQAAIPDKSIFYGISHNANQLPTIGTGTPWKGISSDNTARTIQGTAVLSPALININGGDSNPATIEAYFQAMVGTNLNIGNATAGDSSATIISTIPGQKVTLGIRGAVGTTAVGLGKGGTVAFNDPATETLIADSVDKIIVEGSMLQLTRTLTLGNVPVDVVGNGVLDISNIAGNIIDGNVVVKNGGTLVLNDNQPIDGTGTITIDQGGKLDIAGAPANILAGGGGIQTITFAGTGHTVRLSADNLTDTAGSGGIDASVPDAGATWVIAGGASGTTGPLADNFGSTNIQDLSINTQTAGLSTNGGVITNGGASQGLSAPLTIGSAGATFAATRGTTLVIGNAANTTGNVQIGSLTPIDGRDKGQNVAAVNSQGVADPYNSASAIYFGSDFSAANVSIVNHNAGFLGANTNISGAISVTNGVLYLDGGGSSGGTLGQLTPKLLAGTMAPGGITIGNYSRSEMKLDISTSSGARLAVDQAFIIDGDGNPQDNRRFWVSRNLISGATDAGVNFNNITLNAGAGLGFDEDGSDVRANLTLKGNAAIYNPGTNDNWDIINLTRDITAPANVTVTQGRINPVGAQAYNSLVSNVFGTIGDGVTVDLIRGQLILVNGSTLNGVVLTKNAPVGGDAFVLSTSNGATVDSSIGGLGRIELGRSAAAAGPEDFEVRGTEIGSGTAPLHTHSGLVRVVDDGISNNIDAIIRSNRHNDTTIAARVAVSNVELAGGSTAQFASANAIPMTIDTTTLLGNATIDVASTGRTFTTINAGTNDLTIQGASAPTITNPITAKNLTINGFTMTVPMTNITGNLTVGTTPGGTVSSGTTGASANVTATGDIVGSLTATGSTVTASNVGSSLTATNSTVTAANVGASATLTNTVANLSGNIGTSLTINSSNASINAGGGTRTIGGPVTLNIGGLNVSNGTVDAGTNLITGSGSSNVSGLREYRTPGAFDITSPNLSLTVRPGPIQANLTTGWGSNETFTYTGEFFVPDNNGDGTGSFAFAENFDDSVQLIIDGLTLLNNGVWNDATGSGVITKPTGWYAFEARFGQGTGGAGPNTNDGWSTLGFGVDLTLPVDSSTTSPVQANFVAPVDNGSMNMFRTSLGSVLNVAANSTLKAGGMTNVSDINLNGAASLMQLVANSLPTASTAGNISVATGGTGTVQIDEAGDMLTAAKLNLNGSLALSGAGGLTVTGVGSGTGAVTSTLGVLLNNGTITGPTTVNAGTVGGSGTFAALDLTGTSKLSPGNSPGTLTTGNLTLGADTFSAFELNPTNTVAGSGINDLVIVNGDLNLDGTLQVSATGPGLLNGTYVLFDYSGALTGDLTIDPLFAASVGSANIVYDTANTQVLLSVVAIPEPSTFVLGALGLLGVAGFRLRRRRMA